MGRGETAPFKHQLSSYPSLKFKSLVFQALRLRVQSDLIHQKATKIDISLWPTLDRHIFVELTRKPWEAEFPSLLSCRTPNLSGLVIQSYTYVLQKPPSLQTHAKWSFPSACAPSPVYLNWYCWVYNGVVCYPINQVFQVWLLCCTQTGISLGTSRSIFSPFSPHSPEEYE